MVLFSLARTTVASSLLSVNTLAVIVYIAFSDFVQTWPAATLVEANSAAACDGGRSPHGPGGSMPSSAGMGGVDLVQPGRADVGSRPMGRLRIRQVDPPRISPSGRVARRRKGPVLEHDPVSARRLGWLIRSIDAASDVGPVRGRSRRSGPNRRTALRAPSSAKPRRWVPIVTSVDALCAVPGTGRGYCSEPLLGARRPLALTVDHGRPASDECVQLKPEKRIR